VSRLTHFARTAYKLAFIGAVIGAALALSAPGVKAEEWAIGYICSYDNRACHPGVWLHCSVYCTPNGPCTCDVGI
jgi:hypothetical protein